MSYFPCRMNRFKVLKHRCWNTLDKVDIVDYITLSQLNVSFVIIKMVEFMYFEQSHCTYLLYSATPAGIVATYVHELR